MQAGQIRPRWLRWPAVSGKSWYASDTCTMLLTRNPCPLTPVGQKKQLPGRDSAYLTVQIAATGTPHHTCPAGPSLLGDSKVAVLRFHSSGPAHGQSPVERLGLQATARYMPSRGTGVPKDCPWRLDAVFVEPTPALSIHPSLPGCLSPSSVCLSCSLGACPLRTPLSGACFLCCSCLVLSAPFFGFPRHDWVHHWAVSRSLSLPTATGPAHRPSSTLCSPPLRPPPPIPPTPLCLAACGGATYTNDRP